MSNQGLEVCSFFSSLIIGLVRSKPLHWDQGCCLSLVPLLCCTIPHQSSDKPRGRPEVVERKWMYFMFREHVVWLRGAHIKCCGLGKPPVEKQDASFGGEQRRLEMVLFRSQPSPKLSRLSVFGDKQWNKRPQRLEKHLEVALNERARWASNCYSKSNIKAWNQNTSD